MKLIGYARASLLDRNNQNQLLALRRAGVAERDIYVDKATRTSFRDGWKACLAEINPGDVLVIQSMDRLGRNLTEVFQTVRKLRENGVELKVLDLSLDSRTAKGKGLFEIFAKIPDWAHNLEKESIEFASGVGRKPLITDEAVQNAMSRIKSGESAEVVADNLGVSRQALYKRDKKLRQAVKAE